MNQEELKKSREATLKLQEAFASQKKKYEESKGYDGENCEKSAQDELYSLMCYFDRSLSNVYSSIYRVEEALWEHSTKNHVPQILGPGKMENVIKVLGLDSDYKVEKKVIYASEGKRGEMVVESNWAAKKA